MGKAGGWEQLLSQAPSPWPKLARLSQWISAGSKCLSATHGSLTSLSVVHTGLLLWLSLPQLCVSHPQVFKQPWPGIMRTLYGKHQQFETIYFKKFPGYYVTGDGKGLQACVGTGAWGQQCKSCPVLPSESLISYSEGWHCYLTLISGYF